MTCISEVSNFPCPSLASCTAAIFFLAASFAGCHQTMVVTFFTIAVSSNCLSTSGTLANALDLSARFVGPLSSIVNGLGAFMGIIAPYTVGHLTPSVSSRCSIIIAHYSAPQVPFHRAPFTYSFTGPAIRMASRVLDSIRCLHLFGDNIQCVRIGRTPSMGLFRRENGQRCAGNELPESILQVYVVYGHKFDDIVGHHIYLKVGKLRAC